MSPSDGFVQAVADGTITPGEAQTGSLNTRSPTQSIVAVHQKYSPLVMLVKVAFGVNCRLNAVRSPKLPSNVIDPLMLAVSG